MSDVDLPALRLNYRTTIVGILVFVLGLCLMLYSAFYLANPSPIQTIVEQAGSALLIGGVVTLISEFMLRREFLKIVELHVRRISEQIRLAKQDDALGLAEVRSDAQGSPDLDRLVRESRVLTILMNDGRTWTSTHATTLRQRFLDPQKSTSVILLNPNGPMIDVQAAKEGIDAQSFRGKILQTARMLRDLHGETGAVHKLRVAGHDLHNPQSIFLGDAEAIVTPYFTSRGRRAVPAWRFIERGPHSYVASIRQDLEVLLRDVRDIEDATSPSGR